MKKALFWLGGVLVLAGLIFGAAFLYDGLKDSHAPTVPTVSQQEGTQLLLAPDFTVYDPQGNPVKLSDLRGKPVIINLWASWCIHCGTEMPDFQKAYELYGDQVHFMMINLSGKDSESAARAMAEAYSFPVYYDWDNHVRDAYYQGTLPVTYVIGSQGEAITYCNGRVPYATLVELVEFALQ